VRPWGGSQGRWMEPTNLVGGIVGFRPSEETYVLVGYGCVGFRRGHEKYKR